MLKLKLKNKVQTVEDKVDSRYLKSKYIQINEKALESGTIEVYTTKDKTKVFAKITSIVEPIVDFTSIFNVVEGGEEELFLRIKLEASEGKKKVEREFIWAKEDQEVILTLDETLQLLELQGFEILDNKPPRVSKHRIQGKKAMEEILKMTRLQEELEANNDK